MIKYINKNSYKTYQQNRDILKIKIKLKNYI